MNNLELRGKLIEFLITSDLIKPKITSVDNFWGDIKRINLVADQILALIGKCATPTFSGEKEQMKFGPCPKCKAPLCICPTEQKEYCECICPVKLNSDICANCHKEIRMGKPIPAEKKECGHEPHHPIKRREEMSRQTLYLILTVANICTILGYIIGRTSK